jgi:hypothetical protein
MGFPLFNRVTGDFRAFLFQMAAPLSPHSLCPEVASSFEGGYSIIKRGKSIFAGIYGSTNPWF